MKGTHISKKKHRKLVGDLDIERMSIEQLTKVIDYWNFLTRRFYNIPRDELVLNNMNSYKRMLKAKVRLRNICGVY